MNEVVDNACDGWTSRAVDTEFDELSDRYSTATSTRAFTV